MLPALGEKHIFAGQPITFFIKDTTFWTPSGRKKSHLPHFVRSCRSFWGWVRLFSATRAHENPTRARALCIFRLQEPKSNHKRMHGNLQLVDYACDSLLFNCPACSKHPLFSICAHFFEKMLPALGGKHILADQPIAFSSIIPPFGPAPEGKKAMYLTLLAARMCFPPRAGSIFSKK